MAKIKRFTDEDDKALNNPNALPEGVTEDDLRDVESNPMRTRPGQAELAAESEKRDYDRGVADRAFGRQTAVFDTPHVDESGEFARRMRVVVDSFKKAPAGPEKEKHRAMAWTMAEGIKRDGGEGQPGDLTPGRRTAVRFVRGQEMPCVNGKCNNTVPYDAPQNERDAEKAGGPRASDVTCAEGGCDIPAAVASRPAERQYSTRSNNRSKKWQTALKILHKKK